MTAITYDQLPYPGASFSFTHPDVMATLATLLGLQPAPVERCRVLELGCATSGNLIPMALGLPDSQFLGIDYSARQIDEGNAAVSQLGKPTGVLAGVQQIESVLLVCRVAVGFRQIDRVELPQALVQAVKVLRPVNPFGPGLLAVILEYESANGQGIRLYPSGIICGIGGG